jgi:hypothetical protein
LSWIRVCWSFKFIINHFIKHCREDLRHCWALWSTIPTSILQEVRIRSQLFLNSLGYCCRSCCPDKSELWIVWFGAVLS